MTHEKLKEYVFIDKAGIEHFEMIDFASDRPRLQIWEFQKLHDAVRVGPAAILSTIQHQE